MKNEQGNIEPTEEEWKPAKYYRDTGETEDWSDMLEVSNLGNVRYIEEYKSTNKNIKDKPHICKKGSGHNNYRYITICRDGIRYARRLHRMVLSTFCPVHKNNKKKMDADHIDFNQLNNKLSNLQWMDRSKHRKRRRTFCVDCGYTEVK